MGVVHVFDQSDQERNRVRSIVESLGLSCCTYSNIDEVRLPAVEVERPGCVVFDFAGQGVDGIGFASELHARTTPAIPSILISHELTLPLAMRFVDDGLLTAIEKPYRNSDLGIAITRAVKLDQQRLPLYDRLRELKEKVDRLSSRERSVLDLMIKGYVTRKVAGDLGVATRTVEACRKRAVEKFEATSAMHLACTYTEYLTLARSLRGNDA